MPNNTAASAVFLDRDGCLVRDVRHGADPAAMALLPGVAEALGAFAAFGYRLVVVTNQSGVARGLFTLGEARAMARRLAALLEPAGVRLAGYFLCPHHPEGSIPELAVRCDCRKPEPALLARAAGELHLDLSRSWMIGDTLADVAAGESAGARSVLVDIGSQSLPDDAAPPYLIARSPAHAAALILAADGHLEAGVDPCPPGQLNRPPAPPDRRGTGEPSPWPSAAHLELARQDGEWLGVIMRDRRL